MCIHVYMYHILFIHSSVDGYLTYVYLLATVNNSSLSTLMLLSNVLDIYPKVKFLGNHMEI